MDTKAIEILRGLEEVYPSHFIQGLRKVLEKCPDQDLSDALARQQVISKKWAIEKMHEVWGRDLGMVFILGGWYGVLAALMLESQLFDEVTVRSFDIDSSCLLPADTLNRPYVMDQWKFKAVVADMYDLNYETASYEVTNSKGQVVPLQESPDVIINTVCEHLKDFSRWFERIPSGKKLLLQSTDFAAPADHFNWVSSLEDFEKQAPLSQVLYAGKLSLDDYKRFMIIGVK